MTVALEILEWLAWAVLIALAVSFVGAGVVVLWLRGREPRPPATGLIRCPFCRGKRRGRLPCMNCNGRGTVPRTLY